MPAGFVGSGTHRLALSWSVSSWAHSNTAFPACQGKKAYKRGKWGVPVIRWTKVQDPGA
jgi:hypothetical protein